MRNTEERPTGQDVMRWHSNADPRLRLSGDTVREHSRRVVTLCQRIAAAIGLPLTHSDLLTAALHHDDAEALVGDTPGPAKAMWPFLAEALQRAEASAHEMLGTPGWPWELNATEAAIIDLADRADAWAWAVRCGAGETAEWAASRTRMLKAALAISPDAFAVIEEFIEETETQWQV
ncbi:MAG: hypothetical protein D6773_18505 [Alphaproteobacteria bacterium]|nr:MAG: hypothetical protein D6773_18505 [Alphaproteobacteria bacterium]